MVPIRENLVPKDKYAIKCPYTRTPTRVVIALDWVKKV